MARVTVCIPTYKRTRWLARTIDSALTQTYRDLVVEVHDDAAPRSERVKKTVIALDVNPSAGVAHSRFALIDADDGVMVAETEPSGSLRRLAGLLALPTKSST